MSIHSGLFFFDGRHEAAGNGWDYCAPGIAMAQGRDDVWLCGASSVGVTLRSPALAMTWDGRLDNRDDLLQRLGNHAALTADSDISLATFDQLGIDGLRSLIGEWSLVICDRTRRTLHLARDYMGTRPLYYLRDRHAIRWSSDLAELVERSGRSDTLCDAFAANFMTLRVSSDLTPYEGVHAISLRDDPRDFA